MIVVEKRLGETPLECLERTRAERGVAASVPMTYAGRLDPLAEGKLIILVGDECKEKVKYLGLDKEYEIEVALGIKTDTGDMLGLVTRVDSVRTNAVGDCGTHGSAAGAPLSPKRTVLQRVHNVYTNLFTKKRGTTPLTASALSKMSSWKQFEGKFTQAYPSYSSKTFKGKQLHELARAAELPDDMPTKEVEIYSIEEIGKGKMTGAELATRAAGAVSKVRGDFRQEQIIAGWRDFAAKYGHADLSCVKLKVSCSSGTYMRSLAERMGGMAISIGRTRIGKF